MNQTKQRPITIILSAPNQRVVSIKKALSDEDHLYSIMNIEALKTAARSLSDRAFKLYHYFNMNQDEYSFALSPADVKNKFGMSDKRYREGVDELIDKGYLVNRDGNFFTFYEHPQIRDMTRPEADSTPANTTAPPSNLGTAPVCSADTPGGYGGVYPPNGMRTPAKSGGEIIHNITSNNTNDNTMCGYNNNINNNTANNTFSRSYPKDSFDIDYTCDDEEDMPF